MSLPSDYGYVILTATATFVLSQVHSIVTSRFRRAAGVKYPNAYASEVLAKEKQEAYLFNCAQRAHANFTENHAGTVAAMLLGGLSYPRAAAAFGAVWTASRALYLVGYVRPSWGADGRGRFRGMMFFVAQLALYGLAASTGLQMLKVTW